MFKKEKLSHTCIQFTIPTIWKEYPEWDMKTIQPKGETDNKTVIWLYLCLFPSCFKWQKTVYYIHQYQKKNINTYKNQNIANAKVVIRFLLSRPYEERKHALSLCNLFVRKSFFYKNKKFTRCMKFNVISVQAALNAFNFWQWYVEIERCIFLY